jgi:hypothetical protein
MEEAMRTHSPVLVGFVCTIAALLAASCATPNYTTSPYHPGPAIGNAVGTAVGVTTGNVGGAVVGFGEGVVRGAAAPFDTTTRVIRVWHEEVTPDGRRIQVPQDILVDAQGRPVGLQPAGDQVPRN